MNIKTNVILGGTFVKGTDNIHPDENEKEDMCRCSNCGWRGKVSDCEQGEESEGWEYPSYLVHYCPVCEDGGCIDDYFYSGED